MEIKFNHISGLAVVLTQQIMFVCLVGLCLMAYGSLEFGILF